MKNNFFILSLLTASILLAFQSCDNGNDDPPGNEGTVVLTPSKTTLTADGSDEVTFKVTYNNNDVTSAARIYTGNKDITGGKFSTETEGTYTFFASYADKTSQGVTIKAENGEGPIEVGPFYKKVAIQQFTSVGCTFCPNMKRALIQAKDTYGDDFVVMSYHTNYNGVDPMHISETPVLVSEYGVTGYPCIVVDGRDKTTSQSSSEVIRLVERAMGRADNTVGIKVRSTVENHNFSITVDVMPIISGDYKIGVVLLEDDLQFPDNPQIDNGTRVPDFNHTEVVRKVFSDSNGTLMSDQKAGVQFSKTFESIVSSTIDLEKCTVVVYVSEKVYASGVAKYYINNVVTCGPDASVDYRYTE